MGRKNADRLPLGLVSIPEPPAMAPTTAPPAALRNSIQWAKGAARSKVMGTLERAGRGYVLRTDRKRARVWVDWPQPLELCGRPLFWTLMPSGRSLVTAKPLALQPSALKGQQPDGRFPPGIGTAKRPPRRRLEEPIEFEFDRPLPPSSALYAGPPPIGPENFNMGARPGRGSSVRTISGGLPELGRRR